jgi:hypothetical protein
VTITETTANAIAWWIAADTVVTTLALVLAALAFWRFGGYMRQCRCVVQAYEPLVRRHEDTAERMLPLLADRITESTEQFAPLEDEHPTGRHALIGPTELIPAAGELSGVPAYYFAAQEAQR